MPAFTSIMAMPFTHNIAYGEMQLFIISVCFRRICLRGVHLLFFEVTPAVDGNVDNALGNHRHRQQADM